MFNLKCECGATLFVRGRGKGKDLIEMSCDKCGKIVLVNSGVCPDCCDFNGYPYDGVCMKCYENRKHRERMRLKKLKKLQKVGAVV